MNFLTSSYVKMKNKFDAWVREERGSQTLEWLGIAAVIVIIVGAVSTAFGNSDGDTIGDTIKEKFTKLINDIVGDD